ncbi:hypothetical protein ABIF35_006562 [Bradyrhizobium japonicum]|uniref:hypothetical protein n=1 Tax=Bradyrhizobium diazoefficiens TaxID=1355477 RepID=UPI0034987DB0
MYRRLLIASLLFVLSCTAHAQGTPPATDQIRALLAEIKAKASLKLSPTTDQSAIDAASAELKKLANVNVAASIDETGLNLAIAQQLKADGKFKNPKFKLANQAVDGTLQFAGPLALPVIGNVDVVADLRARIATSVQIESTQQSSDFKIGFSVTALEISALKATRDGKPVSGVLTGLAEAAINGILVPAQTLLNHVELRLPTTLKAHIELKPSQKPGLATSFDPKSVGPKLTFIGFSHIIDNGRLIAVLQEGGTAVNPAGPAKGTDFGAFRSDFQNKLTSSGIAFMNQGQLSAYVDRELIKSLVSRVMAAGPICMNAKASDLPLPFDTNVKLPATETIDCTPTRDCTPKGECRQDMECAQRQECRACQLRRPWGGCAIWGNDLTCEAGKSLRKAACEAEKKARHDKCEADKSAQKGTCEAIKTGEKQACEGFKGTYDGIRRSGADYANVSSKDLLINGDAKVCLSDLAFDPAALRLAGKLQVGANARATGRIKFTPLNIVGHASCFAPVEKSLTLNASIPAQSIDFTTTATFLDDSSQVSVEARVINPVRIRFPVASMTAQLGTDAQFTIFCPIPGGIARARAVTPDSWWPKQARGDLERELPDFKFDLDLVKKPFDANGLQISGRLRNTPSGVGGVFTLSPKTKGVS